MQPDLGHLQKWGTHSSLSSEHQGAEICSVCGEKEGSGCVWAWLGVYGSLQSPKREASAPGAVGCWVVTQTALESWRTASGQALLGLAWDGTPFLQRLCGLELQMLSMLRQRQEALGQLRAVLQKERMATLRRLQESLEKVRGGVGAWGVGGLVPEIPWVTPCVDCR